MIDIPPVWLTLFAAVVWLQSRYLNLGLSFGPWAYWPGIGLIMAGIGLTFLALIEMRRAETTPIPHRDPKALVDTGIFKLSRNPIYLGDVLILLGLVLAWDAVISLILAPSFAMLLQRRFILPEEERLMRAFGQEFAAYSASVRRWL